MKAATMRKKEEEKAKGKDGASSSALMAVGKGSPKREADGKDNHPSKKVIVTPRDKLPKKPSPLKPSHGAGKRLMTTSSPVSQGPDHHLLSHKDYAVEMIESIIKDKDVHLYAEQMTKELVVSGLFYLARVCLFLFSFSFLFIHYLIADSFSVCRYQST